MSRTLEETALPRIAPLSVLPIFCKLAGRRVVLAGSGDGAVWKAELLVAAGARLDIYADSSAADFGPLGRQEPARIAIHARHWQPGDLAGAALAIADLDSEEEARAFAEAARKVGVPCNLVDRPALCDFQFGSVVNRSPLVIGISTDGAAPVFGQAIRARIETVLPAGLQAWAEAAKRWRPFVQAFSLGALARRRLWERFARDALARPQTPPGEEDREAFLDMA